MNQRVSRFLLSAMSSAVLAACTLPAWAVTLNISLDADPGKLDPTQSSMLNERIVYQSIFDKLVDLDGEGKIIPMLAERWTVSEDQKTYTLYLRKGVKFQDGTPFDTSPRSRWSMSTPSSWTCPRLSRPSSPSSPTAPA